MLLPSSYINLSHSFFEYSKPAVFKTPRLLALNHKLADELGFDFTKMSEQELAEIFSGQKILQGTKPISLVYAAHQFGHFVPRLGDGRAHLLGEINGQDIQLKGSGQTLFSRSGDGRSPLGAVVREYILSEAMHALGVPTTRALAAVKTGEEVFRQTSEQGGIFTRVAPSHIRVGTFQYFANLQDKESLLQLLNYSVERHYPKLTSIKDISEKTLKFLESVGEAHAKLIAKWMSYGFIHGVMNTDNSAVGGFTIDYGPCAFMDEYKASKVFSSIDRHGRYAYENQPEIGKWNLLRLADSLLSLIDENQTSAINKAEQILTPILDGFTTKRWELTALKFGIVNYKKDDQKLIQMFLNYLEENELDFTLGFRNLSKLYIQKAENEFSFYPKSDKLDSFLQAWRLRVLDIKNLDRINPLIIPRNHQVQKAIQEMQNGNRSVFDELLAACASPFELRKEYFKYSIPPNPSERINETFCGT